MTPNTVPAITPTRILWSMRGNISYPIILAEYVANSGADRTGGQVAKSNGHKKRANTRPHPRESELLFSAAVTSRIIFENMLMNGINDLNVVHRLTNLAA